MGLTLYGDVDIGMSNIDITYSRYQVVDYSAWIRYEALPTKIGNHSLKSAFVFLSPNEAVIMTRKPRPASTLLQVLKPFSVLSWGLLVIVLLLVTMLIFIFNMIYAKDSVFQKHDTVKIEFVWLFLQVRLLCSQYKQNDP